jgi:hypothetical protein
MQRVNRTAALLWITSTPPAQNKDWDSSRKKTRDHSAALGTYLPSPVSA